MNSSIQLHEIIWFLISGGLVGWLASVLVKGSGSGIFIDVFVGVMGAFLGGFLAYQLNFTIYGFWEALGISVFGAAILVALLRTISRPWKSV